MIPVEALGIVKDDRRRDQWGRYLVMPPGGDRPVGYTRVTTVAKALDEGGGLAPWKATMATCGVIMRPGLRAQWEALMATVGIDPWYAGPDAKAECKRLVEECAAVGGGNDRREIGTALHTITALTDLGHPPPQLTEETTRDVMAYRDGLAAAGVEVLAEFVETTVVLDEHQVAGTFDRIVTVPGFDRPLIADLKSGADLTYSWQSIAVQLAAYSRADAIYTQGPAADGSQDTRTPMPDVDQCNGLIMWLNAGTGRLEMFVVDLDAGWDAFEMSLRARQWRRAKVSRPLGQGRFGELVPLLEASLAAVEAEPAETDRSVIELRDWLAGRIKVIGAHPEARYDLGLSWPPELPTLRASTDHSAEQLAVIERLCSDVERRHMLPFPSLRPGEGDSIGLVLHMFPDATIVAKDTAS